MKRLPLLWALLMCALCLPLSAQDRSYTEGPVMEVTAVKVMGDDKLKVIAVKLLTTVRKSVTIDWNRL